MKVFGTGKQCSVCRAWPDTAVLLADGKRWRCRDGCGGPIIARADAEKESHAEGHAEERGRIVAWLRAEHEQQGSGQRANRYHYRGAAQDIEDGVHWDSYAFDPADPEGS